VCVRGYIWLIIYEDTFGSRLSTVVCKHTTHSFEQAQKRGISDLNIKRAKTEGKMSYSIHLNGEEDTNEAKEIRTWGDCLKKAFEHMPSIMHLSDWWK
jgi:hypothetical protein